MPLSSTVVRFVLLCVVCAVGSRAQVSDLRAVAEWSVVEYEFPSEAVRQQTLASSEYVPGVGVTIDMDVDYAGQQDEPRIFVTVPRFVAGIPITLGTLTNQSAAGGPQIRAYPDYASNADQGSNCDGLTSVFRVAIDECRRLWVLDTGKIGNTNTQNCPPQLVAFDLDTDRMVLRYRFPLAQYKIGSSLFITPVVDVRDAVPGTPTTCPNTMVYVADVTGFGLLVYDVAQNRSWRAQNKDLYSAPHAGTFTIAGESFDLMDGVFGLALTPGRQQQMGGASASANRAWPMLPGWPPAQGAPAAPTTTTTPDATTATATTLAPAILNAANNNNDTAAGSGTGDRLLYFHALAARTEIAVPLRVLDNGTLWSANVEAQPREFREIGDRGIQAAAEAMDADGNLFVGLVAPIAIGCWDSESAPYARDTIRVVARNDRTLQFSSGLKIRRNRAGAEELWVNTCRFQKVAGGTIVANETNYRIQSVEVARLLDGQRRCGPGVGAPLV